jgi:phosphoglycerol transferase
MIILNLVALLLAFICILSFISNKYLKLVLSIVFALFFIMQISSLYIGNSFIDYRYYLHFNAQSLSMTSVFKKEIILLPIALIAIICALFFGSKVRLFKDTKINLFVKAGVLLVSLLVITLTKNGIYQTLQEIYDITTATSSTNDSFSDISNKLGLTKKEDLETSSVGKNIIIISLESFEKAFLHKTNRQLTPNLQKRMQEWVFYPMQQNEGSSWTSGSLYTAFTGLPSFFAGHGNSYLVGVKESKLITLGDVLKQCGYDMYYISNNASFAATDKLLTLFGVNHIMDDNDLDLDIFTKAKSVLQDREQKKPFMIWISTTQTHTPNGWIDERMLQFVKEQKSDLETAALSTDWLVEDFMGYLENENLMENTVVYLFPDHLFMGEKDIFDKTNEKRVLWMMTNANKKDLHIDPNNFYQTDILSNILSGAEIKHNAKFLSDIIGKEDKQKFISENRKIITALNSAAIIRENTISESFELSLKRNNLFCFVNRQQLFIENIDILKDKKIILLLDKEFKILSEEIVDDETLKRNPYDYYYSYITISIQKDNVLFEWVRDENQKYTKQGKKIILNSEDLAEIQKEFFSDNINVEHEGAEKGEIKNQINIKDNHFVDYAQKVLKDSSMIILMACRNDGSANFGKLKPLLSQFGLQESLEGKTCWSYLSAFSNHKIYAEKAADRVLSKQFVVNNSKIQLTSSGFKNGNSYTCIVINGKGYSQVRPGLDVVVFDSSSEIVVDAFSIDTYDESLKIIR